MNTEKLRAIFESSGNLRRLHLPQAYAALETYLASDMVCLESNTLKPSPQGIQTQLIKLVDTAQPWDETAIVRAIPPLAPISTGGGRLHMLLCWSAAAWLLDHNYQVLAEQRYNGCRVDLLTPCHSWAIECGDTSPGPIVKHLLRGTNQIGIIPFQDNKVDVLEIFTFTRGNDWNSNIIRNNLVIDFAKK